MSSQQPNIKLNFSKLKHISNIYHDPLAFFFLLSLLSLWLGISVCQQHKEAKQYRSKGMNESKEYERWERVLSCNIVNFPLPLQDRLLQKEWNRMNSHDPDNRGMWEAQLSQINYSDGYKRLICCYTVKGRYAYGRYVCEHKTWIRFFFFFLKWRSTWWKCTENF